MQELDLAQVTDRNVENLSGGELQRFAIAVVAAQEGALRARRRSCFLFFNESATKMFFT